MQLPDTYLLVGVLIAEFIAASIYNIFVDWFEKKDTSYTWLWVAIGNSFIIIGAWVLLGLADALVLFFINLAAGIPMIAGAIWRNIKIAEKINNGTEQPKKKEANNAGQ